MNLLLLIALPTASALVPNMYCGLQTCYDVLGVVRGDFDKSDLAKIYRKLAGKHHPDRARTKDEKEIATEKFRQIATAYETLKDDESRADYDYYLDNPDEFYYNYYKYYRRRISPKVDVRLVILVTIVCISIVQYISAVHKYKEAVDYLMRESKYRSRAEQMARDENKLIDKDAIKKDKLLKNLSKADIKEANEKVIRQIIEENVDIKGGYRRPSVIDTLLVQILFLPYTLYQYISWYVSWYWRHSVQGQEYGDDEKLYLIRRHLGMSQYQFDSLEPEKHDDFLERELWIKSNFDQWKQMQEEEQREKMAQSGKYKQYRRYMKKGGPGQMTFADE